MTKKSSIEINHVSDTSLWVAAYRAKESERPDALFHDPYAKILIGEHGTRLAQYTQGSRYTEWSVVMRTLIIDEFILNLIHSPNSSNESIDLVINIGAGLDTRPYRLDLPSTLKWVEIDFLNLIEFKNDKLNLETPKCKIERFGLDLTLKSERKDILEKLLDKSINCLILTEGVIPYLSNQEALDLALEFSSYDSIKFWITEYYSPEILTFLRTPKRLKQMENSPFKFYPNEWFDFFKNTGWSEIKSSYFGIESKKFGRSPPTPGWLKNQGLSLEEINEKTKKYLAYTLYKNSKFF